MIRLRPEHTDGIVMVHAVRTGDRDFDIAVLSPLAAEALARELLDVARDASAWRPGDLEAGALAVDAEAQRALDEYAALDWPEPRRRSVADPVRWEPLSPFAPEGSTFDELEQASQTEIRGVFVDWSELKLREVKWWRS